MNEKHSLYKRWRYSPTPGTITRTKDAIAALTIPFIKSYGIPTTIKESIALLKDAAAEISDSVAQGAESSVAGAS